MLVLLIIFLITIPVVTHTVPVHLPKERNQPSQSRPDDIVLAVTRDGKIYWNTQPVPDLQALTRRLEVQSAKTPQPEVQVRGDDEVQYGAIGRILLAVQRAGIGKVGFITEPPPATP
jgi:biopolymer transport protein ExbD